MKETAPYQKGSGHPGKGADPAKEPKTALLYNTLCNKLVHFGDQINYDSQKFKFRTSNFRGGFLIRFGIQAAKVVGGVLIKGRG